MLIPCILGFLNIMPMTGYEIKAFMENSTRYFMFASFGSIYPALRRLEKMKQIESAQEIYNGRLKIIYSITKAGKKEFMKWLSSVWTFDKGMEEMLLRIFFAGFLPKEEIKNKFMELKESIEKKRLELCELEKDMPEDHINSFEHSTLVYGKDFYNFTKNWIEKNMNSLKMRDNKGESI